MSIEHRIVTDTDGQMRAIATRTLCRDSMESRAEVDIVVCTVERLMEWTDAHILFYTVFQTTSTFLLFKNNSVKNDFSDFDVLNPEKIWHENLRFVHLAC